MRRVLGAVFLACLFAQGSALAQLSPTGTHYAGRASDTGYSGVTDTGGFPAAVPLDFPPARGGIGIPISLVHGRRGFGAGGLGWDVPLSFVRRDTTIARHRPARLPGENIQARERMVVSVAGRTVEMTKSGDVWLARRDAPDWELRELPDSQGGTWHLKDGGGQDLTFSMPPALHGSNLWLLSSATTATTSNSLELEYAIVQRPFTGGTGLEIDLVSAKYNTHPSTPHCAKNEIALDYNDISSEPQSLSLLGELAIVRMKKLWQVRVLARESCTANAVTLRRYLLDYADDPDTQQKRLSGVRVLGRDGTPEANVTLPVASYEYGAATSNGKLDYQLGTDIVFPSVAGNTPTLGRTYHDGNESSPDGGNTYVGWENLLDVSGDGRPDLVFNQNGQLSVALNRPAPNGATSLTATPILPLSSSVYSGRPLSSHSSEGLRYDDAFQNQNQVWRQTIDVNGDGRLDVVDAAEEAGVWTIYLNTPGNPITWIKRKFRVDALHQVLEQHGHSIEGDRVPLSRRSTGFDLQMSECWEWDWNANRYVHINFDSTKCTGPIIDQRKGSGEKTFTEWEFRDVNGDGYPDFVFNSSPVRNIEWEPCPAGHSAPEPGCVFHERFENFLADEPFEPTAGANNAIKAMMNVVGVRFADDKPFSAPLTLTTSPCGVAKWTGYYCPSCSPPQNSDRQRQECALEDVNGDGLTDRVEGQAVRLGTGISFASLTLQLPNVPEQQNPHHTFCTGSNAGTPYEPIQTRGLRDLTGDGIPDFIEKDPSWRVWIGTGTGFRAPIAITAPNVGFSISNTLEACETDDAKTLGGLYDIDGDGKPEVLQVLHNPPRIEVYRLTSAVPGNPQAGRITSIANGSGAVTTVTYRSAKEDPNTSHQVPFPEIVVTSIETTGTNGLEGSLSAVRYAYGDAEQFYDPLLDAFTMRSYGRTVEVHGTGHENWDADYAIARQTYGLAAFIPGMSAAERFERYQKAGRLRDTYVLGDGVERDPWELLRTFAPQTDLRRRSGTHHEWGTRYLPFIPDSNNAADCVLVDDPYNWNSNWAGDLSCAARGFTYAQSSDSWLGTQPPGSSASNVETYSEVVSVDEHGNLTELRNENDRFDPKDDACVSMTYAKPTTSARILSALATRRVTNCALGGEMKTLSYESWEFDGLPVGDVALGRVTSRSTERHATDNGQYLDTIREYEIGYDSLGNPSYIASAREDGAVRTLKLSYDEFGLAPTSSTVDASGIDPLTMQFTLDPLTLALRSQRDVYGTVWGVEVDGFGRTTRTTVEPANGTFGIMSTTRYDGFASATAQRSITTKVFRDPVRPDDVDTTDGQETTTWFDELGRPRLGKRSLGRDYNDELVVLSRKYDGLGRVTFEADPYPTSQNGETAYGTSYYFDTLGELACSIRGHGPQPLTFNTDLSSEVFPTCFTRTFSNHELEVSVSTPDSLDANTPQAGTSRSDTLTAIGRLKRRETLRQGVRLEASSYEYDYAGQLASLKRFANPGASPPVDDVEWTWRHDSRGQTIYSTEPEVAARSFTYSSWGEPIAVNWMDTAGNSFAVEKSYDALGRLVHSHDLRAGKPIDFTEYDWTYDTGETSPRLTPTFTTGRLTKTHSLIGDMHLSYDALGSVSARAFQSKAGDWYVERHEQHADGTPSALAFELPDTNYAPERYEYEYDSASRLRSVTHKADKGDVPLYAADTIDAWGRVRSATYGGDTTYQAAYADTGRRLLLEETIAVRSGDSRSVAYRGYDAAGRELERYEVGKDKVTTLSVYDALGRLARSVDGFQGQAFDRRFTYDALGNLSRSIDLVTSEQTNVTFSSVDRDRMCRIDYGPSTSGPCNVAHDESGNIVDQVAQGVKPGDPPVQRKLAFFPSGAISQIQQGAATAEFLYDGSGEISYVGVSGAFLSDARNDRRFGLVEHREVDVGGTPQSIIERHIPGPGGVIATRKGSDETFIFPFADSRGTRTTTNGSSFVQDVTYQPFGKPTSTGAEPQALDHTQYQWNGGNALADLGIVHLGARLYDPTLGRFLSRDPLIIPASANRMNPYSFASNDPVNFADPTGLCTQPEGNCQEDDNDGRDPLFPPLQLPDSGTGSVGFGSGVHDVSGPSLLPKESTRAIGVSYVFQTPLYRFPEGALGEPYDFYDRLSSTPRGTDFYDPSDISYSGVPFISWMYGDPTEDIGKYPPWRVIARIAFEYFLSGAAIKVPPTSLVYPTSRLISSNLIRSNAELVATGGRWAWGYGTIRATEAEIAYQAIRESATDVAAISRYTGYSASRIQRIKTYLFNNPEWNAADETVAATWHRLRTGRGTDVDRLLLKHETAEMWLRANTDLKDYWSAHRRANIHWNWQKEAGL